MIQYVLLERAPRFLKWYRTRFTLDWPRLVSYLPEEGSVLDIGCGVGLVDHELGQIRPHLEILGTDISTESIARARQH
ncbi:MAG: class I SAM-dependent methyltransferase, partial [Anaerolineae bacterium]